MDTNNTSQLKPIEIFKPGSFVAADGKKHTFTTEQVQEMVDGYNVDLSDAPLVVGHPKQTSPRFGRAAKLFINDAGIVCAEPDEVCAEFAEAVNAKHYPKISASIYLPGAPGNPTPGKHYLRHIGFLGGAAPAVKGLKSVEFSESEEGVVDFGYEDRMIVGLFRRMRDWIASTSGVDKAQEILPDYTLDTLTECAIRDDMESSDSVLPAFSNPTQPTEAELSQQKALDDQAAALALREKDLNTRAAALAAQEVVVKKASHADFAEALCVDGRLLPAQKVAVVEILTQLDTANQIADFAEGDENHGKTGADLFKAFLSTQPAQVTFNRVSQTGGKAAGTADFAAPDGAEVDTQGLETVAKANQYVRDHPGTPFMEAVKIVQAA